MICRTICPSPFYCFLNYRMEQKKSTQKRLQLLNAALDVFSLYGFNGASLDEIAQIAEMHKSNIFYYYENKEAL